jgi:hypothetical protein
LLFSIQYNLSGFPVKPKKLWIKTTITAKIPGIQAAVDAASQDAGQHRKMQGSTL